VRVGALGGKLAVLGEGLDVVACGDTGVQGHQLTDSLFGVSVLAIKIRAMASLTSHSSLITEVNRDVISDVEIVAKAPRMFASTARSDGIPFTKLKNDCDLRVFTR